MNDETGSFSENIQMYLVTALRLRKGGEPVALPKLAHELDISTASVNEMCRKLEEQGLMEYRPYAGVSLTPEGERLAKLILRKHRLWEVFLVDTLNYDYNSAHETACRLEHATPPHLADRLESHLGRPLVNPQGEPIPYVGEDVDLPQEVSLSLLSPGEEGVVSHLDGDSATTTFLQTNDIKPGSRLRVMASGGDTILVRVQDQQTVIGSDVAKKIFVNPVI